MSRRPHPRGEALSSTEELAASDRPVRRLLRRVRALAADPYAIAAVVGLALVLAFYAVTAFTSARTFPTQVDVGGRDYFNLRAGDEMEVARYSFKGGELTEDARLLDGVKADAIHDSGRIHFGPDDGLYVSTGDAGQPDLAQDHDSLNGKFLRLDPKQYRGDGGRPQIVSRGHRNPQGFDWQPRTGRLIATEHGPTGAADRAACRLSWRGPWRRHGERIRTSGK